MSEDDVRTEVSLDGNRITFTVICVTEAYAQKGIARTLEILADEGSDRLKVTFRNVSIVP